MKNIFLHEPYLSSNEIKNLSNCVKTGWVSTGGPYVKELEKNIQIIKTNTKFEKINKLYK
jgi:dTDP-4-amino-4,6-dideoxygalactose transaminase